jgi:hypothetical protein
LGIVVIADLALWAHEGREGDGHLALGGFGLALFLTLVPVLLFVAAPAFRRSARLAVIVGMLGLVVLRCALAPTPGVVLTGFALAFAFALALRARRLFVPEAAACAVTAVGLLPSRIRSTFAGLRSLAARTRFGKLSLLPIVVPAALVLAFLGVFALANPLVAHGLATAWAALSRVASVPSFGRVFFWTATLLSGLVLLRPGMRLARGGEHAEANGEASGTSLLVARNALVAQNVLFLGYNALDARYLWAGSAPAGMTTQHYAHAGAFWLTIALVMLTAVIGVMFRGPLAHDARARTARALAYAWIAQGFVLAFGTYRRIAIHIAKSGLSDLRIVGILGTTLVVCGVVLALIKLRRGLTFTWLLRRQLDALAVTTVLYAVAPTHLLSARVNVARVEHGEYRPILHAFRQSHEPESAAALLPLLDHPDVRVREGVAALLDDERSRLHDAAEKRTSWRERDVAASAALRALDGASDRIAAALGPADPDAARHVLLEISRVANEDRSLEELFAIREARGRLVQ